MEISYEELKKAYDDLTDEFNILQEKFHEAQKKNDENGDIRIAFLKKQYEDLKAEHQKVLEENKRFAAQYEKVVAQNQSLQSELRERTQLGR